MQRYFVEHQNLPEIRFDFETEHHIKHVMRYRVGETIEIVQDGRLYFAKLTSLDPVIAHVEQEIIEEKALPKVTIVQSLVKENKMDFILQKATELGVSKIIPYQAARSVVKVSNKEEKKLMRWRKIVKEASEQSKRIWIPEVTNPYTLSALCQIEGYDIKILCTVNEMSKTLKQVLQNIDSHATILFVIGPEGGFTKEEEDTLLQHHFLPCSLGPLVFRTETVALYLLSVVDYLFLR